MIATLSNAYRSWAFRVTIWLLFAAAAGALTFVVWGASQVKPTLTKQGQTADNPIIPDPAALLASKAPNETVELVKPVEFDAVIRDMRSYPDEFKDINFIKANKNKYTVQVMNVGEHDVVADYLLTRDDRKQFNYFRITNGNAKSNKENPDAQKRYVLTYGLFGSQADAVNASRDIKFDLPPNVKPIVESISVYEPIMDDYEISLPVQDLSNAPRAVRLNKTNKELPAPKAKPKPTTDNKPKASSSESSNTTSDKTQDKPKPKDSDSTAKPARSIKESSNKQDTLSIQETRAPRSESRPLPVESGAPPKLPPEPPRERPVRSSENSGSSSNSGNNVGNGSTSSNSGN